MKLNKDDITNIKKGVILRPIANDRDARLDYDHITIVMESKHISNWGISDNTLKILPDRFEFPVPNTEMENEIK